MAIDPHEANKHILNFDEVTPLLLAGNNMCCQVHFEQKLLSTGVRADISLESERIDNPQGVDFFLWLPVEEDQAPKEDQLMVGIKFMKALVDLNIRMYLHCKNGHGRTGTFLIGYFIGMGKTYAEAFQLVKSKRPAMHLQEMQISFLKVFESKHRGYLL